MEQRIICWREDLGDPQKPGQPQCCGVVDVLRGRHCTRCRYW